MIKDVLRGTSRFTALAGHVLDLLAKIPAGSIHCAVTSPPYWSLRDYGTPPVTWPEFTYAPLLGMKARIAVPRLHCSLGLEKQVESYIGHLVLIFRSLRRALRDDGTFWLNLGDCYSGGSGGRGDSKNIILGKPTNGKHSGDRIAREPLGSKKNLMGIPGRVAEAMKADGWILRSECVWGKKCPMCTSQRDRPTTSHEMVYLFAKSEKYFYDLDADRVPLAEVSLQRYKYKFVGEKNKTLREKDRDGGTRTRPIGDIDLPTDGGRNLWTVWKDLGVDSGEAFCDLLWQLDSMGLFDEVVSTLWPDIKPEFFKGNHFAPFPSDLPRRAIRLGTSSHGVCRNCGAPWVRKTDRKKLRRPRPNDHVKRKGEAGTGNSCANTVAGVQVTTTGWEPSCKCDCEEREDAIVLDPFCGAGTSLIAARDLGRRAIGFDLSEESCELTRQRVANVCPMTDAVAAAEAKVRQKTFVEND